MTEKIRLVNTLDFGGSSTKTVEEDFEADFMDLFQFYYESNPARTSGNRYLYATQKMSEFVARLGNKAWKSFH